MNITYKEKDLLLKYLCETCVAEASCNLSLQECLDETKLTIQDVNSILKYFQRIKLVGRFSLRWLCPIVSVELYTEAFDVFNRGGFTMQENLLQKEVEKLLLEIERLKPTFGDKIQKVSSIANNIAGIAGSFAGGVAGIKSF